VAGEFVHLHVHTDFSRLDGMETVEEVANFAAADGQPAAAITDHGNMSGYIKFEQACAKAGVRPIPGLEAYFVDSYARVLEEQDKNRDHMLMLAVSDTGYHNLMRMSSRAFIEQNYYKPLVDDDLLAQHAEGLVLTTGCIGSPIGQALLRGDTQRARDLMGRYRDIVGPERYFAEIQVHDFDEQQRVNSLLVPLAKDMGIPLLATQDAHYAHPSRADAHDRMLAMQTGVTLDTPGRFRFASKTNYLATAEQMRRMVPDDLYPGACDNTLLVAEMAADITPQVGSRYLIPAFPGAEEHGGEQKLLRTIAFEGARERYGDPVPDEVVERLEYELGVIHDMGFDAYFLIVWDMVKWAKDNGIYVGPGRGSAAGAVTSYVLGITTLDPIHHRLYFERFLNPGRKSMPDIDIDFEKHRRSEVRDYLRDKYGYDHVAYIATAGKFHGRSAIQAAARIYGVPSGEAQRLSATFPQNSPLNIHQMLEPSVDGVVEGLEGDKRKEVAKAWEDGAEFRKAVERGGEVYDSVVDAAADVEGYTKTFGVHAAAVLITPEPLTNFVPLTTETRDKSLAVCAYDKDDVEAIGGLKMDLLGLINLTTIHNAVDQIYANYGKHIDVNNLPLDDPKTFALLQRADTDGVFQLSGTGIRELVRRVMPTTFEDLSAILALYRPGPMGTDMHLAYADRKNGRARVEVEHEDMLAFAGDTFGLIVYQEQMLALATQMAGFTAAEADTLRKATGKKDAALLAAQESKFKDGMRANGYSARLADTLWQKLPSFAAYSFNKAHSAAYAMVAYQTAYLKAHYPAEFAAACVDTLDDPTVQMQWAKAAGVVFDVPDVNQSAMGARAFTDRTVRLGLMAIKGLGEASCEAIIAEREANGPFTSLSDFMARAVSTKKVNKAALQALIEAGALDSLWPSRGEMLSNLEALSAAARAYAPRDNAEWGQGGLLDDIETPEVDFTQSLGTKETMRLSARVGAQVGRLGVFLGEHPMALFQERVPHLLPQGYEPISADAPLGEVRTYGVITAVSVKQTRRYVVTTVTLESDDGYSVDAKLFADAPEIAEAGLGSLLLVDGVLQEDEWGRQQMLSNNEDLEDAEAPRQLYVDSWSLVPLAALDTFDDADDSDHNVLITIDDEETLPKVASRLLSNMTRGQRLVSVRLHGEVTPLPERVAESADDIAQMLEGLDGVTVARA